MNSRGVVRRPAAIAVFALALGSAAHAQFSQQGLKLRGNLGEPVSSQQGFSVSLSADGNTALLGAPSDETEPVGAVWVFTRSGTAWTQGARLIGLNEVSHVNYQGWSTALSADGSTAVIGGFGGACIFVRAGGEWSQQVCLAGTGSVTTAPQGEAVAISADGNTVFVGAQDDELLLGTGAAWIFVRNGTTWSQQGGKLVGTGAAGPAFQGASVALSADGNTALVGGPGDNDDTGAAWVFTRSAGTWTQQGSRLVPAGNVIGKPNAGFSVALSANGNTALLGGPLDDVSQGAAWVFTRSGSNWTQQSKLVGTGITAPNPRLGTSVALSADGNTAILGAPFEDDHAGAAWVFTRSGSNWSQLGSKLSGTGAEGEAEQGSSVALSGDGKTALVGGPFDALLQGAAWVFTRPGSTPPAPSGLVATATANTSVTVTWNAIAGVQLYDVARSSDGETFIPIGSTGQTTFIDDSVSPHESYLYKVRTLVPPVSPFSAPDVATTLVFTDASLTAKAVKGVHFAQLRTCVNAMRALAGLAPQSFTDASLTAGSTRIKRVHLTELRSALDAARTALALPAIVYSRPVITAGSTRVGAIDLVELRNGVK